MAVCPELIYSQGGVVLVIRIGDLPMGSGTLGLQCCEKRFYSLPDHVRANGSSGDPTDQASLESLIYRISPQQRFNHIHRLGFIGSNQAVVRTSDREPDGAGHY